MNARMHLWLERLARAFVDFIAVQAAGIVALYFIVLHRAGAQPSEGALAEYYVRTFVPISLVFPFVHMLFGLYTKLRGYTLGYKLRLASLSASVATLLLVFLSFPLNRSLLPRSAALLFSGLAVGLQSECVG